MAVTVQLADEPFEPDRELARFMGGLSGAGAVVSFVGIARDLSHGGDQVTGLFLDHHPRLTLKSLEEIAGAAAARFAISEVIVVHRCGEMAPGEPIVLVGAAAAHRRVAFDAVDYMMDRLKSEAVFWKREDRADGSDWIEPTQQDCSDLSRWSTGCRE